MAKVLTVVESLELDDVRKFVVVQVGIWIGFSIAVGTFAVLLVWRFHRLSEDGRPLLGIL